MITIKPHSLVGTPSKTVWSQVLGFERTGVCSGVLLRMTNTLESDLLDLASVGGAFLQKIQEEWDGGVEEMEWLMQTMDEAREVESRGINVDLIIYRTNNNKLMLWGSGGVAAYLMREENLARLGDGVSMNKGLEGELNDGDIVILASENVFAAVGIDVLGEMINDETPFEDNLAPLIYKDKESAGHVAQILNISEDEQDGAETPVPKKKWVMPSLRIQRMSEEPKRFNLIAGGVLIVGLIVLVLFGVVAKSKKQSQTQYLEVKTEVERMLGEAKSSADTNPERAKILLSQAKETINTYIASEPKEVYLTQANSDLKVLEQSEKEILKVRGIELASTVELGLLSNGMSSSNFESDGLGNIYFWDNKESKFVGFNLGDSSSTKYEVKDISGMGAYAVAKNGFFAAVDGGIWQGGKSEQKVVIDRDELWGKIGKIGFFGSNVYLLDLGNGEIWKYSAVADGYSDRKRWFGAGIVLDLSKVVDWVVDGDIWLLTSSGKLERYSRGVPTKFELIGFPAMSENGNMKDPRAVVVSEDKVYVLESGASRVVAFDLDGKYQGQSVSADFSRASDLAIYKGKGYVLVDNVVKEWEL